MAKQQYVLVDGVWTPIGGPPGIGVPTGGTTGQVLSKTSNTDYATTWVTPSAGTGGTPVPFYPSRASATVTTASLSVGAHSQVTYTLAASYRLLRVTTSAPCRVRVYANTTKRTNDLTRAIGADIMDDHGLFLEFVSTTSVLAADLSPAVDGYDNKTTPNGQIPVTITNTGAASTALTVTFTWLRSE